MTLWDLTRELSHLAAKPSLRCLFIGEGYPGEAEFVTSQICQKEGDRLFIVHHWLEYRHEELLRKRLARYGEKATIRNAESVCCWLADPKPVQRWLTDGSCGLVYVDVRAMSAFDIAARSGCAWRYLAPGGLFVWRDYLHRRRADIKTAVDQVLADRPHRVVFQNGYLGVALS